MGKASGPVVGFDLGGTKMMAALVDSKYKIVARKKKNTRGKDPGEDIFDRMVRLIKKLCDKTKTDPKALAGIGVGSPGPLDPVKGYIFETANLPLKNFPLKEKLEKEFGVPVEVENDVTTGTLGEYHFGAGRKGANVLGVFPGTGIGGGLIVNGRVYTGSSHAGGEIGHIVLDPNGPRCGCGHRGCLEAYASRTAITAQCMLLILRGQAPALAKETGGDPAKIKSSALARAIDSGDKYVEEIVREAAARIGLCVGSLVNVLSPDTVVLGGGMVEAMPKLFLEEVEKNAKVSAMAPLLKAVRFAAAELGDDAVMMGAAKLIEERR